MYHSDCRPVGGCSIITDTRVECLQCSGSEISEEDIVSAGDSIWYHWRATDPMWYPCMVCRAPEIPHNIRSLKHTASDICIYFFGSNTYEWKNGRRAEPIPMLPICAAPSRCPLVLKK